MSKPDFTTEALHSDRQAKPEHGALHQAIHPSVAFSYEKVRDLVDVFQGRRRGFAYGRQGNPTVEALAKKITHMEQGLASVCFSTGMAAIGSTLFSLLRQGDHVVSSSFLFGNTNSLLASFKAFGVEISFVDATDANAVAAAIQPTTRLVFVETIANPATQVADLEGIGVLCREHGLIYVVDNTMTSPRLFNPRSVGASLIINALTKYIGGHGNALGGCVTDTGLFDWTAYPHIYDNYKSMPPELWGITQIRKKGLRDFGAAMAPDAAHHLSVGSDTLALRMDQSCTNARAVAEFCAAHSQVSRVFYPGLPQHPQHERASQLFRNYGALLSIDLAPGVDCFDFLDRLELVVCSSNLGDTRSLAIPVAHTIYWEMGPERRASMGIDDSMIRFSIGIENTDDLLADFSRALA